MGNFKGQAEEEVLAKDLEKEQMEFGVQSYFVW